MASTPKASRHGLPPRTPGTSQRRLNGCFDDGVWKCNCNPRLPAIYLQVKKKGPNRGKFFYICRKPREQQCKFFLWQVDAEVRAKGSLFTPSTTRAYRPLSEDEDDDDDDDDEDTNDDDNEDHNDDDDNDDDEAPPSPSVGAALSKRKRQWAAFGESMDPTGGAISDLDSGDEQALLRLADQPTPATPSGGLGERAGVAAGGLPTPASRTRLVKRNSLLLMLDRPESGKPRTVADGGHGEADGHQVTAEVMQLLQGQRLETRVLDEVRTCLDTFADRVRGIERGRYVAREAVRSRDGKIADLQSRITALERERDVAWEGLGKSNGSGRRPRS